MVKGVLRFASTRSVRMDLTVNTPHALLGIRGTIFDVFTSTGDTEVAVREGVV